MVGEMLRLNKGDDCRGCWGKALGAAISGYTKGNPQVDGAIGIATPNVKAVGIYRDGPVHCSESASVGDPDLECSGSSGDGLGGNAMRSKHPGGVQAVFGDGRVQLLNNNIDKLSTSRCSPFKAARRMRMRSDFSLRPASRCFGWAIGINRFLFELATSTGGLMTAVRVCVFVPLAILLLATCIGCGGGQKSGRPDIDAMSKDDIQGSADKAQIYELRAKIKKRGPAAVKQDLPDLIETLSAYEKRPVSAQYKETMKQIVEKLKGLESQLGGSKDTALKSVDEIAALADKLPGKAEQNPTVE